MIWILGQYSKAIPHPAYSRVGLEVPIVHSLYQLLGYLDDFLLAGYKERSEEEEEEEREREGGKT